ncbi:MAG: Rid family detoxifying hydrolase [Sporomusaceae bacterium]|nr:Rid family detoxifying hydrolase [Sporomusaceae bacterium]
MNFIKTNDALEVNGHYSQAVEHNGTIYISGILPFDNQTGKFVDTGLEEQVIAVFSNLDHILEAAGSSKEKILKTTVYIPGIELWDKINALYGEYFGEHRPARSIVPTTPLHFNSNIELEVVAYK